MPRGEVPPDWGITPPFKKKNRQIVFGGFSRPKYITLLHSITFFPDSRMCTSEKPSWTGLPEATRSLTLPPTNRLFPTKALPAGPHWLEEPEDLEFAVESDSTKKFRRRRRTCAETLLSQLATSSNNLLKLIRRRFIF